MRNIETTLKSVKISTCHHKSTTSTPILPICIFSLFICLKVSTNQCTIRIINVHETDHLLIHLTEDGPVGPSCSNHIFCGVNFEAPSKQWQDHLNINVFYLFLLLTFFKNNIKLDMFPGTWGCPRHVRFACHTSSKHIQSTKAMLFILL